MVEQATTIWLYFALEQIVKELIDGKHGLPQKIKRKKCSYMIGRRTISIKKEGKLPILDLSLVTDDFEEEEKVFLSSFL